MSFLDKIPFLRKKDELTDSNLGLNTNMGMNDDTGLPPGQDSFPQFQGQQPGQRQFSGMQPYRQSYDAPHFDGPPVPVSSGGQDAMILSKNLELLNAKLDTLKASMDSINQRIANIESMLWEQRRRY